MICKRIDFIDVELEETIKGYLIIAEDEIIVIFEGYNKQGFKKFNNVEEIVQELIHTKEKLNITEEMLDEEIKKSEDYEEILNDIFEEN
ncbi:MAG: hypothetical protein IKL68_06115 [Clostridia bacterium]|nr:hypothetical protein [Clostridia bacterium]